MTRVLVLGLGNTLRQDDGLGVRALECLRARLQSSEEVQFLDGGTLGLDLLPRLAGVTHLLLLDAVNTGQPAGTLRCLVGDEIPASLAPRISPHQMGLLDLLAVARLQGTLPPKIVLWGLQPASLEWGTELTPAVKASLDALVEAAIAELATWGALASGP